MCRKAAVRGPQRHDPGMAPLAAPPWRGGFSQRWRAVPIACKGAFLVPWARIDDGFDDHPKVLALLEHDDGAAAIGLWTLCLAWAHRNTRKKGKVPGHVPASLPRRYLGILGRDAAKLLVDVGLWDIGEDGWDIHDFDQYLPTTETSSARSAAGKKGAAARWGKQGEPAGVDGNEPSADGNLPSDAMANDGNRMAADGSLLAPAATEPGIGASGGGTSPADGNLPFPDGNEPSADSKPMASDGSRAPARRAIPKGIAPTPTPTPSSTNSPAGSSAVATAPTAQTILADFIDWVRGNSGDLTKRTTGHLARQVGELLDQGKDDRHIRRGLADWFLAGQHSATLDSFVNAAINADARSRAAQEARQQPAGAGAESTGAARARAAMEAGRRVQARIDNGGHL